jgi:hypothetical protein
MKLIIGNHEILLLDKEFLEHHTGHTGFPFNLDTSICGIKSLERAQYLLDSLINSYPFPRYKMEVPKIYQSKSDPEIIEVLFSISDFTPIITC